MILQQAKIHLEDEETFHISHTLLKVILQRRLMLPEIYDLIDMITHSLVSHSSSAYRQQSRSLFLVFLLHYPLDEKKIRKYFDFLLSNLNYAYSDGRESVLEMLFLIVSSFPSDALSMHSLFLFISLALRLVNEEDMGLREHVQGVLKALILRLSSSHLFEVVTMTMKWIQQATQPIIDTETGLRLEHNDRLMWFRDVHFSHNILVTSLAFQLFLQLLNVD